MLERTFMDKEAKSMLGFKVFKDKITVLLGGSVTGYKVKPFMMWHSEKFRASVEQEEHPAPALWEPREVMTVSAALPGALLPC